MRLGENNSGKLAGGREGGGQANWLATPKGESGTAHWPGGES